MRVTTCQALQTVSAASWDALSDAEQPFVRHAFLAGLETHRCLEGHGWYSNHLLAYEGDTLVGALPLYSRDNSYGEFVFDWAWAEAYERAGGRYYPKIVSAIPFTPVAGPRLLLGSNPTLAQAAASTLIDHAINLAREHAMSSWHCLFPCESQLAFFAHEDLVIREGCQYHWYNQGYATFDEFLSTLNSKRRKEIKRERRELGMTGLTLEVVEGAAITPAHWDVFYAFYCDTFDRKFGAPRFTESFFHDLNAMLPGSPVLFLARDESGYVAGAFALRGPDTLYGRHWGCRKFVKHLHFELCYYQTIDYCIRHGLHHLDAGAQGEHKIPRGFTPRKTWSTHWIRDPNFRRAVKDFCARESNHVGHYIQQLGEHSAYRISDAN